MSKSCPAPEVIDDALATPIAGFFSALAESTRLRLALFIYDCAPAPVCACAMPATFNVSRSTLSHHLTKLVEGGVLSRSREGKWSYYTIDPDFDTTLLDWVRRNLNESDSKFDEDAPNAAPCSTSKPVTILFACRKNAGRSQIAAAVAKSLAAPQVTVLSAGSTPADTVHQQTVDTLAEIGLEPDSPPSRLDPQTVKEADWVITMGCGESCPVFPGKHYEDWPVADPDGLALEQVHAIREEIRARVADLLIRIGASQS